MEYETKKISKCCKAVADTDEKNVHYCVSCGEDCEYEVICAICEGTGEITVDELDHDSHQYTPTGTRKCLCQVKEPETDDAG
jgi:hypothetical protein